MSQKELIQSLNAYWKEHKIFEKSLDQRSEKLQSVTYDGPPFANGKPHFGHGLTSSMKDTILRYKTMKGYKVNRDRGRDCHGLPVEKTVEQELGIDGKKDIENKIGIEKFVEACRASVSNTSDEWVKFIDRIGRRADMDNAYYTMDLSFMESVIRVFQNMYNQNLVYKGFKVQRYCPSCATSLSNSEVNEGYKDRQDPAITIKFPLQRDKINNPRNFDFEKIEMTSDGFIEVVDCIIKRDGKIFMNYSVKGQKYVCPGGKVDKGDTMESTVKKEIKEELGVEVTSIKTLGSVKQIIRGGLFNLNMFEIEIKGEPQLMEPEKLPQMIRAEIVDSDNSVWFAVKIEDTIIDDDMEIMSQFYDLYIYHKKIFDYTDAQAPMSVLAWTTTPWTLPSNTFLAVGNHIRYATVYDIAAKEYFVIAENLLKQYYKKPEEYILIKTIQGEGLVGVKYEPLFPHINNSKIEDTYKKQFFKIIPGEFVSTEDGTGIVHIAPSFGAEDFEVVAQILPREKAKERLFLPVGEYGEFTDEVPERKNTVVYEANKGIIQALKEAGKLIGQRSYEHSYPHCRRCDTPLISKALTSRFIKEPELTKITSPNAENIGFVPEGVKKRFIDVLNSAPDRNLARNRYRWSPIPIWEAVTSKEWTVTSKKNKSLETSNSKLVTDDRIVIGTLEELYQHTRTGSQNITKNILIRHGQTIYNETNTHDSYSNTDLNETGKQQAQEISTQIENISKTDDIIIILTPLSRTFQTITPYLETKYGKAFSEIKTAYETIEKTYQDLRDEEKIQSYLHDISTQKLFNINEQLYVDFRTVDIIIPEYQNLELPKKITTSKPTNQKLTPKGEAMDDVITRCKEYTTDINTTFKGKTIVTVTHKDSVILIQKAFKDFDYLTKKYNYSPNNGEIKIRYRDNDRNTEVDLHKPYIDNYRFTKNNQEYRRIPEVMDCRFESGSMPFGQAGYIGDEWRITSNSKLVTGHKPLVYPADFIIEGLDQTRGRFRTMHVCGNAVMKQNSFNNVVINGMVLAEDGKKMSKKLKNYPDPEYLFGKYGSDAYRLYLLSSPGVKAEPVKFSEKGVEQTYKDFTASITNAYKFFETYAKVDKRTTDNTNIYCMKETNEDLSKHIEYILRTDPDCIYTTNPKNAQDVVNIMKEYREKTIEIKELTATHETIKKDEAGKKILIISDETTCKKLRKELYNTNISLKDGEIIKLPSTQINNELDKRILAELNNLGLQFEQEMNNYLLDNWAKLILWFVEKLNNRFIRRSRRRFRASGMDQDKHSAFSTLFEVLENYMKIAASFAPFITEHIYLELQKFILVTSNSKLVTESVHLEHLPLYSKHYIDKQLLEEIETVRKIISLGLFIRSKNRIAVKQPLAKMSIK